MDVDLKFGLVLIMGQLFQQKGLAMRSGLAAGAATLYAAWVEDKFLKSMSLIRLAVFQQYFLVIRWMDDRLILVLSDGRRRSKPS